MRTRPRLIGECYSLPRAILCLGLTKSHATYLPQRPCLPCNGASAFRFTTSSASLPRQIFWVDALCINQTDARERTHQVNMMGKIYRLCTGVLCYLGDGIGLPGISPGSEAKSGAPPVTTYVSIENNDNNEVTQVFQIDLANAHACTDKLKLGRKMEDTLRVFAFICSLSNVDHISSLH